MSLSVASIREVKKNPTQKSNFKHKVNKVTKKITVKSKSQTVSIDLNKGKIIISPEIKVVIKRGQKRYELSKYGQNKKYEVIGRILGDDRIEISLYTNNDSVLELLIKFDIKRKNRVIGKKINLHDSTLDDRQRQKRTNLVGVLILSLLIVGVAFGSYQKNKNEQKQRYLPALQEAKKEYEEAKTLSSLNPTRARELILKAKQRTDDLIQSGIKGKEVQNLNEEIKSNLAQVAGIYDQKEGLFLDLSLISGNFKADRMSSSEKNIALLDSQKKKIVTVDIKTKKTIPLAGGEFVQDALNITTWEDEVYLLSSDGVRQMGEDTKLVIKINEGEFDWDPQSILLDSFAGNLYMLEKSKNYILRFTRNSLGFGEAQSWIAPGIELNLSEIKNMTIDGNLWTLSKNGITRFVSGVPQRLEVKLNKDDNINPDIIKTAQNLENIYLFERQKQRIVVISKTGEYKNEYRAQNLEKLENFTVSEEDKKIIYLNDNKLFEINL